MVTEDEWFNIWKEVVVFSLKVSSGRFKPGTYLKQVQRDPATQICLISKKLIYHSEERLDRVTNMTSVTFGVRRGVFEEIQTTKRK
jgi:hypothetical protein